MHPGIPSWIRHCCRVTSVECDRSFSVMRRLKTWLRCTTGQSRLNHEFLLVIHSAGEVNNNNNNIRLLETTDKPQSLDHYVIINVNDGQSPPRQLRVSSLPTAVTRWGDSSTQLARPSFELGYSDPKPSALPTAPPCLTAIAPSEHV